MLSPAKMKFRKLFKGRIHGKASRGHQLSFGSYGLKALAPSRITSAQIEAARRAITRSMKRVGKVWIRIYPHIPVTQKPAEVRMGSGKGAVEYYACRVYPGMILFEMDGVNLSVAKEALGLAAAKLPIQTKIVARGGGDG
ncbi:MAG: 50S ribosomal protein L16 [Holosporaceae bacterium]|jgi:large subunit ribosomal protein L16|nr:50S ribosomal protein L16 [Holosporaceae bacterium]